MRNLVKDEGKIVTRTAPAGGAKSGEGYVLGSLFVVATGGGAEVGSDTVAAGLPFEGRTRGEVSLAKVAAQVWAENDIIYWDDTAKEANNVAGDMVIGEAAKAAASADATGVVWLYGTLNSASVAAAGRFVSTEQTGTGAPQNIAHGLGVIPSDVFVAPTDLAPATTGEYTVTEGAHDATDVIVTVTSGKKFKVIAWR